MTYHLTSTNTKWCGLGKFLLPIWLVYYQQILSLKLIITHFGEIMLVKSNIDIGLEYLIIIYDYGVQNKKIHILFSSSNEKLCLIVMLNLLLIQKYLNIAH